MLIPIFGKCFLAISLVLSMLSVQWIGNANPLPATATTTNASPGDVGWSGGFTVDGFDNSATAIALDGSRVYVGGVFGVVGNVMANCIAMWDGSAWTALGDGLNGSVRTLAVDGRGHLYAGGDFTLAGQTLVNHITRWDGQTWQPVGSGTNGAVYSIAIDSAGKVYAGGGFDQAGGIAVHQIALWNGVSWQDVGGGVTNGGYNAKVYALTIDRYGFLFTGGFFNHAGGIPANNIARWDGSAWTALGEGITGGPYDPNSVYSLAADSRGNIYAGGWFTLAGGISAENIARWNGDTWSAIGGGIQSDEKSKVAVISILPDGENIYVGGLFYSAGGTSVGSIARWDGYSWDALQGGVWQDNLLPAILGMAINRDGMIYVVGDFVKAGGQCAKSIAIWDGLTWNGLRLSATSTDEAISAMIPDPLGGYYAIGAFTCAGGQVVNHIAHWDGTSWSALGNGLSNRSGWTIPQAVIRDQNGSLYVAGSFTQAGNTPVDNITRWNGSDWEALGPGLNGYVNTLAIDSMNRVYVGGYFYLSGSDPTQYSAIVRWDGVQWEDMHSGINGIVTLLAFDDQDRLVAGGYFNTAGGVAAQGMARWDGLAWEALCNCSIDAPHSILFEGDTIYVGSATIWKIHNGTAEVVGGGVGVSLPNNKYSAVNAMELDQEGKLIVGGEFTKAGQVDVRNIARWDGETWKSFGSGIGSGFVSSMNFEENGKLLVAGRFSQAGGKVSRNLAVWIEPNYFWFPVISR